jgi:dipeptidyl-peptidase III
VIKHLRAAQRLTEGKQNVYLGHLINYFETGSQKEFNDASIAWLEADPEVDIILGFIESYMDPRGVKGQYEAVVTYKDPGASALMKVLADNVQQFEDSAPWPTEYKKRWHKAPVANAVNLLVGVGHAGPRVPLGINLPNSQVLRETHGSKSIFLVNIARGVKAAVSNRALLEFWPAEEQKAAALYRDQLYVLMVGMHEVLGHGSGKVSEKMQMTPAEALKETYAPLEEARADLVALYHSGNPLLLELGLMPNPEAADVLVNSYFRSELLGYRRLPGNGKILNDHMMARHLIVEFVADRCDCVKQEEIEGKTFRKISDMDKARAAIGELLTILMKAKAEGDYKTARELLDRYAAAADPMLVKEIVARAKAANIPQHYAFNMPLLKIDSAAPDAPQSVVLDYSTDFDSIMESLDTEGESYY